MSVIPSAAQTLPMDYSYCGYQRSEKSIPSARTVVYVQPVQGDNAALLQQAIDYVGRQKADPQTGLRGAVVLGDFGIHHFYTGDIHHGVLHAVFFWTGIPAVIGIIEGIMWLTDPGSFPDSLF